MMATLVVSLVVDILSGSWGRAVDSSRFGGTLTPPPQYRHLYQPELSNEIYEPEYDEPPYYEEYEDYSEPADPHYGPPPAFQYDTYQATH